MRPAAAVEPAPPGPTPRGSGAGSGFAPVTDLDALVARQVAATTAVAVPAVREPALAAG